MNIKNKKLNFIDCHKYLTTSKLLKFLNNNLEIGNRSKRRLDNDCSIS